MTNCFKRMKEYLKESGLDEKISDDKLRRYANLLTNLGADVASPAEFASKFQNILEADQARLASANKAANAFNLMKREKGLKTIILNKDQWRSQIGDTMMDKITGKGQFGNKNEMAIEAFRVHFEGGSLRPGVDTNTSLPVMKISVEGILRKFANEALKPVRDFAEAGAIDRAMMQELDALQRGLPLGQSGDNNALAYAKAFNSIQDKIFSIKQAYNPFLEKAENFLVNQFHYQERVNADMSEKGRQDWLDQAMASFGEKSFPDADPEEKPAIMSRIYKSISDGTYGSINYDSSPENFTKTPVRGGGNIMQNQIHNRKLIATDWEKSYDYFSKYGPPTAYEGLDRIISRAASDISKLIKFGSNPREYYEGMYQRVLSKLEGEEAKAFGSNSTKKDFDKMFNAIIATQDSPSRGMQAKMVEGALLGERLAKTGKMLIRSQPDIVMAANLITDSDGKSLFVNSADIATEYYKSMLPGSYARERMSDLALFANTANKEMMRSLGSSESQPGKIAQMGELLGTLNLGNRHDMALNTGVASLIFKRMGDMSGLKFSQLSDSWKQGMARYGITENAWNVMRFGTSDVNGIKMVTPEGIESLDPTFFESYLRNEGQLKKGQEATPQLLERAKSDLTFMLTAQVNEQARLASARADSRQRNFLLGDADINDPKGWGALRHLIVQMKTAALVQSDIYRRNYFSGNGARGAYVGVARLAVAATFMAGIAEIASQLADGKKPEDPKSLEFAGKVLAASGMAGVMGDIFVNEANRNNVQDSSLAGLKAIAGPAVSDAVTLGAGLTQMAKGNKSGKTAVTNTLLGLVPGQNLFYATSLFHYHVANSIKDFIDPGSSSRQERATTKKPGMFDSNQKYFMGRPTSSSFLEK